MRKRYSILLLAVSVIFSLMLTACQPDPAQQADPAKLQVAVSFNAMKEFVQAVGQDKVQVTTLIPDGTEPHEFQPTPREIKALHHAKVLVCNGMGMEPWQDDAVKAADNKSLVVVDAADGVTPIHLTDPAEKREHGEDDPHTWLSLVNAQIEVQNIADALAKADPDNARFYQDNAKAYKAQLQQLLAEYQAKFQQAGRKDFVTSHAAFAYLCRDFGLDQKSVEDVFASGEPTSRSLATLIDYSKANQVKTIFVEEAVSTKTADTLANEVGAKTQVIHTMESSEGDKTYLDRMKENLAEIYASLQ